MKQVRAFRGLLIALSSIAWLACCTIASSNPKDAKLTLPWGTYQASSYDENGEVCLELVSKIADLQTNCGLL